MAVVIVLGLATGCHSVGHGSIDETGPMHGGLGDGLSSLVAPHHVPWNGTYGSILLCTSTGDPLVIDAVRYDTRVVPLHVRAAIRETPALPRPITNLAPVISRLGTPQRFLTSPHDIGGEVSKRVVGRVIDRPCSDDPLSAHTELLTVITSDESGGWISSVLIDYHTPNGIKYQLDSKWDYIVCGTDIPKRFCHV